MPADPHLLDSLAKIKQYHDLGSKVPERKYRTMGSAAENLNLNIDYMRAAKRFAVAYTPKQLDRLCDACKAGNYAIGWVRVMLLLTVPATDRDKLLTEAIKSRWSKAQLSGEIRRRYGSHARPGAGRPTKIDDSPESAYLKALELCSRFDSFMRAMNSPGTDDKTALSKLPGKVQGHIRQADESMTALRKAVEPKVTGKSQD